PRLILEVGGSVVVVVVGGAVVVVGDVVVVVAGQPEICSPRPLGSMHVSHARVQATGVPGAQCNVSRSQVSWPLQTVKEYAGRGASPAEGRCLGAATSRWPASALDGVAKHDGDVSAGAAGHWWRSASDAE